MLRVSVALLGFGNVGRAFARYVKTTSGTSAIQIRVRAVADSSGGLFFDNDSSLERVIAHKASGRSLSELAPDELISDAEAFVRTFPSAGISLMVESFPTNIVSGEPALALIAAALEQGTDVVTVDKGPVVHGFELLQETSGKSGARLGYSGTTGVSIPDEVARDRVLEIRGVLNGTTNFILTEMQQHRQSFGDALAKAQAQGIAEPDPTLDLEGWDTACKILILARSLMAATSRLSGISRIGIGPETESLIRTARDTGRVVRLVGRARIWQGRVRVSVAPKLVRTDSPFYSISGASKAAVFRTEGRGEIRATCQSGRDAISQTIMDDIVKILAPASE
jgi:homoserine dehydrogenase